MSCYTKLVGVTYDNSDGTNRQVIIARLTTHSLITLSRDYGNLYDPNAISVLNSSGERLGFINKELAAKLAPQMDRGSVIKASIASLTGVKSYFICKNR